MTLNTKRTIKDLLAKLNEIHEHREQPILAKYFFEASEYFFDPQLKDVCIDAMLLAKFDATDSHYTCSSVESLQKKLRKMKNDELYLDLGLVAS